MGAVLLAWLFFKLLPLRQIGCYGNKMLCESRCYHHCLNLLMIFFHFRVTQTGITKGAVQHATLCVSFSKFAYCKTQTPVVLQVAHFFQILW